MPALIAAGEPFALGWTVGPVLRLTGFFLAQGEVVTLGVAMWRTTAWKAAAVGETLTCVIGAVVDRPDGPVAVEVGLAEELSVADGDEDVTPLAESLGDTVGVGGWICPGEFELAGAAPPDLACLQLADLVVRPVEP